jgi:predicted Rossmann fold flavoprotein
LVRDFDAIILGGGAAGLMCAIEAGKRGRRVAILERAERMGKKILISGGGRCNFTNLYCGPDNFLSSNPHFTKSALARFTPQDFLVLVESHGIAYHEKTLGQLFCDRSAQDILGMLEGQCRESGVQSFVNTSIQEVLHTTGFVARTAGAEFRAPVVVVATGGLSIPKMGATGFGYDLARQFGLAVRQSRPALVPLRFGPEDCGRYGDLAGVSAEVVVACGGQAFREKMLITHRGLSGPAVLQISSYWKKGQSIAFDLAPDHNLTAALLESNVARTAASVRAALQRVLPDRLASRWLENHTPSAWTNRGLKDLERQLHHWAVTPEGTEGFQKAEVTAGGVDTEELWAKTMESRKVRGLFFIGEVVDVTGQLGGFNFQWAWASGASAGRAV